MANPNITAVTSILGDTTFLTPSGTTAVVLLPNGASSGNVFKINQIVATNVNGSTAVNATVSIYTNGGVAQGSAPSGGNAFPIVSTVSVPANAALVVVDKTTSIYLNEANSITVTSGTASGITYSISYESIS
jgi:hypothetical protein